MRTDELHKFSDGMLSYVRTALHDITSGIRIEYMPKRKWSGLDKQRARVIIQDIDKQLFQRRIRYSFPGSIQNWKDLPRDIPLVRIEILSHHGPSDAMHNPSQPLKKKAPAKVARSKGIYLLSEAALLEESQLKKALKRSKRETSTHKVCVSSEGVDSESKGDSGDEADEQSDDERTESDNEPNETDNPKTSDDEEETQDDEFYERINEELYGDVNVSLTDVEPTYKEKDDKEMTVDGQVNVNQEGVGNQVKDDA
ncbi:hypothetical protein Tco_0921981 [Tanacetum coccineum]|uniref:Uncharacterized protein n=1 Tax=Tanacetum coccineum TaxID=301880 RepID=A0ABQ5CZK5_9ASTR